MAEQQGTTATQEHKNVRQILVGVDESNESILSLRWMLDNVVLHQIYILRVQPTLISTQLQVVGMSFLQSMKWHMIVFISMEFASTNGILKDSF